MNINEFNQIYKEHLSKILSDKELFNSFIRTIANNYKYDFKTNVMINKYFPNSSKFAKKEFWNKIDCKIKESETGVPIINSNNEIDTLYNIHQVLDNKTNKIPNKFNLFDFELKRDYLALFEYSKNLEIQLKDEYEDISEVIKNIAVNFFYSNIFEELDEKYQDFYIKLSEQILLKKLTVNLDKIDIDVISLDNVNKTENIISDIIDKIKYEIENIINYVKEFNLNIIQSKEKFKYNSLSSDMYKEKEKILQDNSNVFLNNITLENNTENKNKDMDNIIEKLNDGVKDIFTSGKYQEFLLTMSKFHNYSVANCILINLQCPNATMVAGYKKWKEDFQRNVNKGEKAISIIAPCFKNEKSERYKLDNNGNKIIDKNGKYVKEIIISKKITHFRKASVFDISQTSGKKLPEIAKKLDKDFDNEIVFEKYIKSLEKISPVPIKFDEVKGSASGYFNISKQEIVVDKNLSQYQKIKTTIHELAHSILHNPNINQQENIEINKNIKEIQAESTAYIVCNHFNIDTSEYSFGYVASWGSKLKPEELKQVLNSIKDISNNIITSLETEFLYIENNSNDINKDLYYNNIENKKDDINVIKDNFIER